MSEVGGGGPPSAAGGAGSSAEAASSSDGGILIPASDVRVTGGVVGVVSAMELL